MINKSTMYAALQTEVCGTDAKAEEFVKMIFSEDPKVREEAVSKVNAKYAMIDKALNNETLEPEVYERVGLPADSGIKSASTGIFPVSTSVSGIDFLLDEFRFDTEYERLFQNVPGAEGSDEITILDFINQITHKEYNLGDPIDSVPFAKDTAIRLGQKRFGGGSFMLRQMLKNQSRYTVNGLIRGHAAAEMVLRANQAYTAINALSPSAETFDTNIITTINKAYVSLIGSMATAGYQVTSSTPAFLLCNIAHKAAVNAAFRTIIGDNGTNILLEYPVIPIFTANSNFDVQKSAKNFGLLVVPQQKWVWGNFTSPRVEQTQEPRRDATELTYQYYFNFRTEQAQTRIVNLQA